MKIKRLQGIFRAFSDGTRLRILHLLTLRKDLCVCDMMAVLKLKQPKISRHLAYLRRAELVSARKEGLWNHYSLIENLQLIQRHLFDGLRQFGGEVPSFSADERLLNKIQGAKKACQ